MHLKPINDTIIVKLEADQWVGNKKSVDILKRGLVIAPELNTMKKKSDTGEIISWGSGCKEKYKIGQKIIFRRPSIPVSVDGNDYRLIIEPQALGVYD